MHVIGPTVGARDLYLHLPLLEDWVKSEDYPSGEGRVAEIRSRASLAQIALEVLPAGDNPYADCRVRVGYDPKNDSAVFIRKVDGGEIYIASTYELDWKLN